ncbi:MAG: hypothetical protein KDL87_18290, partial [Verrucomicrobiae bacterium]|nr:hypothetical protein [Verrucomicrobiae bacterium]
MNLTCPRKSLSALCASLILLLSPSLAADDRVDFNQDVRPILSENCFTCHGPDASQRQADLRLDLEDGVRGSAVVPGHPEDSELLRRVLSDDPDEQMPPPDSRLRLTESDKAI